ncbi:MAG TPA: hypothetical protein VGF95_02395 [Solirubrobacteraceae bacterium]|jgi:hypothetical protein
MRRSKAITLLALAACLTLAIAAPLTAQALPTSQPLELIPGSFQMTASTTQAAAHENLTTAFNFAHEASGTTHDDVRTIVVNLPAGFDASNTAVPTCPLVDLLSFTGEQGQLPDCPVASQLGKISFELTSGRAANAAPAHVTVPLYNMEVTSFGVAAELGFRTQLFSTVLLVSVRPGDDGLTVTTPNIPQFEIHNVSVTVWGVPAAHEHDAERGEVCGAEFELPPLCHNELGGPQHANVTPKPFLSNPTSCGSHTATISADSWEEPLAWTEAQAEIAPTEECERVPFAPSLEVLPTTRAAETATGLNVTITVPQQWENPYSIATANLRDTTVTLPEGITINPSAGSGLAACSPAQYEAETSSSPVGAGCPQESKIGSIEIETPILAEVIKGAVYVATPYDNRSEFGTPEHPGGSLLALYVVAKDPVRGILIKVAGKVALNPVTGQLVTTFENTPQQPFSRFTLKFRPGATAPLVSPATCGSFTAQGALTPWSSEIGRAHLISSQPFEVSEGVREGACPSAGTPPFAPKVVSGTEDNAAGAFSPFYLRISREDGEQELTKFSTTLPAGLSGSLTGIPFCSEADIEAARNVTGTEELEHPSCPAASEIGHTVVEAGVGTVLAQTPGKVYLAGPYHGAPLSIVSITSAKVGPFDLGTVVIRFALSINPITAQVEVSGAQSDPIPHIIDGIVVHVRNIRVYMDRPDFILNPTNCEQASITDAITGAGANPAIPADQDSVAVQTHFQAADCQSLAFTPAFKAFTAGKTSRKDGASLHVTLDYPHNAIGKDSNLKYVKVELPKALPARLSTLQKACTSAQFDANPAGCPAESVVGHAAVRTPILPVPLEGPAYFVSYGGAKFPELVIVLQGYGITIDLHGETLIENGVTSSTFKSTPDVPFEAFALTLPQGQYSALAANSDLCTQNLTMPTDFIAQNGATLEQQTPIEVDGCPNRLSVVAEKSKGRTLTLKVGVPGAGKLEVSGRGLKPASAKASRRQTLTLELHEKQARVLKTKVSVAFTPSTGKTRKRQVKSLSVRFKARAARRA